VQVGVEIGEQREVGNYDVVLRIRMQAEEVQLQREGEERG
jgi:hypothetical protein